LFPIASVRIAEVLWHIRKQSYQIPEISTFSMFV
jgi:hypothetical protein